MAPLPNDIANGVDDLLRDAISIKSSRFSDIPPAIDIPVAGEEDQAVEVNLEELLDDTTELCQMLENERAPKSLWITIAMAYAKQEQIDHAVDILQKGLISLGRSGPKDKIGVLGCLCWLYLLKSRQAPRVSSDGQLVSEAKTKDHFLREAITAINDASRLNPAFPPLNLARGVLSLLRASLQSSSRAGPVAGDAERAELLRQALKCFEDAFKTSGRRNMMAVLGRARVQYLQGRFTDSLQSYQEVLSKMPSLTDPDSRIGIGCCLWRLGFKDRAKVAWERSLSLNADSKIANALLGIFYLSESSKYAASDPQFGPLYRKAMTEYTQKAYKMDGNFPLSCATFANYFLLTTRYQVVEPLARKAIEQTDVNAVASDGWFTLARKEHEVGEYSKANDYYNRADQARGGVDRGYLPAKFGVVQSLIHMQDLDGAKFRLEKLVQSSKSFEAMTLLGCLHAEEVFAAQKSTGKEDKSAEARKAINLLEVVRKSWSDEKLKARPDESVLLYLARLYETGPPMESMKCLQLVEQMQLEKIDEAEKPQFTSDTALYLSRLREHLPPQLLNNMACFHYASESFDSALETFQTALNACVKTTEKQEAGNADPSSPSIETDSMDTDALVTTISYNLARTYESLSLLPEAQKVYEGLLARHPDYTDASARLTYIALRESPTSEGPKRMSSLYHSDSTNVEVRALMGWYLNRSKRRTNNIAEDQEQRHYKHTLQGFDKHDKYSLTGMGNIYLATARDMPRSTDADKDRRRKMYEKAVEFFDKALQLDTRNAYAAQGIAIALVDDKRDHPAAVQILSRVRDAIRDASVHINLGHAYAELRQYQRSIENYETALRKVGRDAENAQILACLSRVWLLKGKADKSYTTMTSALAYSQRALAAQPDMVHLQFNIAFVQFQIAQLMNSLPESQRTTEEVQDAAAGLEDAIQTFQNIAKVKQPPYPKSALEQRAAMGKNTMRKQLERAERAQREYEDRNQEKLVLARGRREEELRQREEEAKRRREAEEERQQRVVEERRRMIEMTQKMTEQQVAEQAAREAAEWTEDEGTGERVKRKDLKKRGGGGSKSKKRKGGNDVDDFIEDDGDGSDNDLQSEKSRSRTPLTDAGEKQSKPSSKRRKLERKGGRSGGGGGGKASKYKSSELVIDSDSDGDGVAATSAGNGGSSTNAVKNNADADSVNQDKVSAEPVVSRPPRKRKQHRMIADDDEGEDDDGAEVDNDAAKHKDPPPPVRRDEDDDDEATTPPLHPLQQNTDLDHDLDDNNSNVDIHHGQTNTDIANDNIANDNTDAAAIASSASNVHLASAAMAAMAADPDLGE